MKAKERRRFCFVFVVGNTDVSGTKNCYFLRSGKIARAFDEWLLENNVKFNVGFPIVRFN